MEGIDFAYIMRKMMAFAVTIQALEARVIDLESHVEKLHEHNYMNDNRFQKIESGSDYLSRVIDDLKRDLDLWRD